MMRRVMAGAGHHTGRSLPLLACSHSPKPPITQSQNKNSQPHQQQSLLLGLPVGCMSLKLNAKEFVPSGAGKRNPSSLVAPTPTKAMADPMARRMEGT